MTFIWGHGSALDEVLLPSMEAYWPLSRSIVDVTRRFNGVLATGVDFPEDPTWQRQVAQFNQGHIRLPFGFGQTVSMTLSAWIKSLGTEMRTLFGLSAEESGVVAPSEVLRLTKQNELQYVQTMASQSVTSNSLQTAFPKDGEWHHVVLVVSGGLVMLYLDGQLKAESSGFSPFDSTRGYIGARVGSLGRAIQPFDGFMTDMRVWRVALNGDQVVALWATTSPGVKDRIILKDDVTKCLTSQGNTTSGQLLNYLPYTMVARCPNNAIQASSR